MSQAIQSPPAGESTTRAPGYDSHQSAFHTAFTDHLYRIVDGLPLPVNGHTLDAPCGDGFYSRRLAQRLDAGGRLTVIDFNDEYLHRVRTALADLPTAAQCEVMAGDVYKLPFPDGEFDFVFCAQSLISLEPLKALRELARVLRPGGTLAVLESDEIHQLILPWSVGLELAVQKAVYEYAQEQFGEDAKFAPARRLRRLLANAGLEPTHKQTFTTDRQAPFDPAMREFLTEHFARLRKLIRHRLSAEALADFDQQTDPESPQSVLNSPDADLTCLNVVHYATKHG